MAKLTKRMKAAQAAVQPGKFYGLEEALKIVKDNAKAKFPESVDVAVRLGIDAKKSDQGVRGSSLLPHGTGKTVKVAVFCPPGEKAEAAKAAGLPLELLSYTVQVDTANVGTGDHHRLQRLCLLGAGLVGRILVARVLGEGRAGSTDRNDSTQRKRQANCRRKFLDPKFHDNTLKFDLIQFVGWTTPCRTSICRETYRLAHACNDRHRTTHHGTTPHPKPRFSIK